MSGNNELEIVRTVDLGYEQMLVLSGSAGTRVRVIFGSMWLTEEGDQQDRFAASGTEILLNSDGRTLIEGMGPARVLVITPLPPAALTRRWMHVAGAWFASLIARIKRSTRAKSSQRAR